MIINDAAKKYCHFFKLTPNEVHYDNINLSDMASKWTKNASANDISSKNTLSITCFVKPLN